MLASSNGIVNSGSLIANGGDGGGSNNNVGFGGGGAGGIIVLAAPSITQGTLSVEAGNTGADNGDIAQSPRAGGGGGGALGGSGGPGARVTIAGALEAATAAQAGHTVTIETDPTALL